DCREQRIRVSIEIARYGACSKIEPVTENQFGDQMIGGARYSYPQPEINFPLRRKIQVHGWKNLVLLLRHGIESRDRSHRAVIFQTAGNFWREVVAEFEIRREDHALAHAWPMKRPIKCGIQGPIPASYLLVHDGPHFPRPRVH